MISLEEALAIVSGSLRAGCRYTMYAVDGDTYVFDMDTVEPHVDLIGDGYPYYTASESGLGMYPAWSPETMAMLKRLEWTPLDN